jgi:hypothetical protein
MISLKFFTLILLSLLALSANATAIVLPSLISFPENQEKNINLIPKTKVLIFINRTCPCTEQNIPYINELSKEYPMMEFIGIHSAATTTQDDIDKIIKDQKVLFSIVNDKNLLIANLLKANRTPQAIILSKDNTILYSGGITNRTHPKNADKLYLKNALAELASNKEVTEKETRSLGCIIVR